MPNNKWDDENIENLLKDFPAIKDERPKEDVYKRLQQAHKPQKKSKHWIPYLVAALAFITFGVLLASMMGQNSNESAFDMSGSEGSEESGESHSAAVENGGAESESAEMESSEAADTEESADSFNTTENTDFQAESTLYPEQIEDMPLSLFTVGLTENAVVVPVSFIVWHDRLEQDFGTTEVAAVDLYNRYAADLDEQALGFDDYHPYIGTIAETADGIEHTLPADHGYDMASASMGVYFNSLSASFSEAAEISIIDEAGNAANFDQVGPVQPIDPAGLNLAYYAYTTTEGSDYLAPGYDMPHDNAVDALNAMKTSPNDLYASLIPEGLAYSVSETDEAVIVDFEEAVDFDSFDQQAALRMIEGMVLTADSFGKELIFNNTAAPGWNMFDFTEALPVPAGINVKNFNN